MPNTFTSAPSRADHPGDVTPSPVRRPLPVRIPESGVTLKGTKVLGRLETWAAYVLADRQTGDAARREIAEVA